MLKKCKVVMLATNEKAKLYLTTTGKLCICSNEIVSHGAKGTNQHLYILSNENIKEGDWYIDDTDIIRQSITSDKKYWDNRKDYGKIIATTDNSLVIRYDGTTSISENWNKSLPQPSNSFIEKYIERYNSGAIITDVMVEYKDIGGEEWSGDAEHGEPFWNEILRLKVNPKDNTITIKSVKDSWNREEVKELIYKFNMAISKGEIYSTSLLNKWIENNL